MSNSVAVAVWIVGVVVSVSVITTLLVPAVDGVPEMTPVAASKVSPPGRPVANQFNGATPPVAFSVKL